MAAVIAGIGEPVTGFETRVEQAIVRDRQPRLCMAQNRITAAMSRDRAATRAAFTESIILAPRASRSITLELRSPRVPGLFQPGIRRGPRTGTCSSCSRAQPDSGRWRGCRCGRHLKSLTAAYPSSSVCAVIEPGLHARSRHPHAEAVRIVVAARLRVLGLDGGQPAEFAGPDHQRILPACPRCSRSISNADMPWSMFLHRPGKLALDVVVGIPIRRRRRRRSGRSARPLSASRRAIRHSLLNGPADLLIDAIKLLGSFALCRKVGDFQGFHLHAGR